MPASQQHPVAQEAFLRNLAVCKKGATCSTECSDSLALGRLSIRKTEREGVKSMELCNTAVWQSTEVEGSQPLK